MNARALLPTTYEYANAILSDVGVLTGLTDVTAPGDCLCRSSCTLDTGRVCTFGVDVPVKPRPDIPGLDCGRTTQDEQAMLQQAYGCR